MQWGFVKMEAITKLLLSLLIAAIIGWIIYRKYYKKKQEALEVQRVKQTIDLMLYDITNANKLLGISDDLRFEQIDDKVEYLYNYYFYC